MRVCSSDLRGDVRPMTKIHLYGQDFEVFESETEVNVEEGALIVSPAKMFILQTQDRKHAPIAVFMGSGGETYAAGLNLVRVDPEIEEHFKAHAFVIEQPKSGK